jgi:hypothetical protein
MSLLKIVLRETPRAFGRKNRVSARSPQKVHHVKKFYKVFFREKTFVK